MILVTYQGVKLLGIESLYLSLPMCFIHTHSLTLSYVHFLSPVAAAAAAERKIKKVAL